MEILVNEKQISGEETMFVIGTEDLENALKIVMGCEEIGESDLSGFRVWLSNRLDSIIIEEARRFTGVEPPIGFA